MHLPKKKDSMSDCRMYPSEFFTYFRYMASRRQTDLRTHASCNAVTLVWGSLRLAPTTAYFDLFMTIQLQKIQDVWTCWVHQKVKTRKGSTRRKSISRISVSSAFR